MRDGFGNSPLSSVVYNSPSLYHVSHQIAILLRPGLCLADPSPRYLRYYRGVISTYF